MKPLISYREAITDPQLLGGAMPGPSWLAWRALTIAAMGEALTDEERAVFTEITGREREPLHPAEELWGIVGRRGGKTRAAGTLAAYIATLCDHSAYLAPGERGVLPILAASTIQADRAFMHVLAVLEHSPELQELLLPSTSDTIRLSTRVDVQVRPSNFRTVRGITAVAAVADELAFWTSEGSANPDTEILNALRPSLATTGGPLIVISSPYAQKGELYRAWKQYFGPEGDPLILVAKAPSRTFNPTLPQHVIDRAYERDAEVASAEYGGNFREDLADFVSREAVEACIEPKVVQRAPQAGPSYMAFVDMSGGRGDSATLGIAHTDDDKAVLDLLVERKPPHSPEEVVTEFADLVREYGLSEVHGDGYAAQWAVDRFSANGIEYLKSERTRSEIYLNFLPLLNSRRVVLLDDERMIRQLVGLKRRTSRGGRDSVDHIPGQKDDVANSAAGAIGLCALSLTSSYDASMAWV